VAGPFRRLPQLVTERGVRDGRERLAALVDRLALKLCGAVITTPRHQVDVIVTEYGAAELQGKTVHQRGEALAAIAHPAFRDELREAAERASHGRSPFPA
jgi:hypothetical protein